MARQTAPHFISSGIYRSCGYGAHHPLGIPRIGTVEDICTALGWFDGALLVQSPLASFKDLTRFHDADYVTALEVADRTGTVSTEARQRFRFGTLENPVFKGVFERASTTVGGSVRAAQLALENGVAYHPAGGTHHGRPDRASGFCYFNDPVFAILAFLDLGVTRVAYVDFDAHHGDGVQDAFDGDRRMLSVSLHEENRWPHSGAIGDRGAGNALNLPVPAGLNDSEFRFLLDEAVMPAIGEFSPGALVVTCGADALSGDPLSRLELSNVALWEAVGALTALQLPTVVLGGGGYNPWTVARCWSGLWARLTGQHIPDDLPEGVRRVLSALECDLVDEEDIRPEWLVSIADAPNEGDIRERVTEVARAALTA